MCNPNLCIVFAVFFCLSCGNPAVPNGNKISIGKNIVSGAKPSAKKVDTRIQKDSLVFDTQETCYDTLVVEQYLKGGFREKKFVEDQQELAYYRKFCRPADVNKQKVLKPQHSKSEITYLGKLTDLETGKVYHVLTNFTIIGIGQMLSPRGKSTVVFLDEKKRGIVTYRLNMPYELPKRIERNILFFEAAGKKIGISIS